MSASSKRSFITPLPEFSRKDVDLAGGKGANLGELLRAGFPVPPGFVVTTAAYDCIVANNQLDLTIAQSLQEQVGDGATIRNAFDTADIPVELEREILVAYREHGQGPVAVRSSATAEDLPEAAFAGQQETFLNIAGEAALLDAVRSCWASLWSDRAIAYRERLGLDHQTVKLAVVVQKMVAAEVAGVMFTANPITGERREIVIDAHPGLGEAVVSGLVTPDHFILRRQRVGWKLMERRSRREAVRQERPEVGLEYSPGQNQTEELSLTASALRQLAGLGVAIHRHFGIPQDIEWAWAGGKPFILQARPMTALPDPPPRVNRLQRMLASNFGEMMPVRPYPLDMDTWLPALERAVDPLFELLGLEWSLLQMFEQEDGVATRYTGKLPQPTWRIVLAPARLIAHILRYNPAHWQSDSLLTRSETLVRDLEAREMGDLAWEELLATVRAAMKIPGFGAGEIRVRYFPRALISTVLLRLILVGLGQSRQWSKLLSGVGNKTLEMNQALEDLAEKVRSDPDLARTFSTHGPEELGPILAEHAAGLRFQAELDAFLARYGHRETVISTALEPTWKDAPEVALRIVKSFAAYPPPVQTGRPDWETAREEVLQHPLLRIPFLRSIFLEILAEARALLQIREDTHFFATLALPVLRRAVLEFGRRLARANILDTPEEVFHLRFAELERTGSQLPLPAGPAKELRAAMERRKQARARHENRPLFDPRLFPQSSAQRDELLRGMPGSPGVAEGPARIIRDISEFDKLMAGDVLVARYTNPSWTPLFQRAVAVVVDSGSLASHAAIVAREYGIPAVMATLTGTQQLHDGERILVDGNRGIVKAARNKVTNPSD